MIDGIYVRVAIALVLIGVGTFGGCHWQGAIDRGVIAKRDGVIAEKQVALQQAALALRSAAISLRSVDAASDENLRAAGHARARAQLEAESAERDAKAAKGRVESLEQRLAAERAGCVDGSRPICGVPLR